MHSNDTNQGPMIRHVVWDWNGTLTDDVDRFVASLNRMLARRRLKAVDREAYREVFDFPVLQYYRSLGFDLEREDWNALSLEFHEGFQRDPGSDLRPEVRELLAILQTAGLSMSVLSALEQSRLDCAIDDEGLRPFLDPVIGADDLKGHSKLESGRALAARLPFAPESVCLVGDTTHDHAVAAALGWHCLLISAGHHTSRRLNTLGAPVVRDLNQAGTVLLTRSSKINPF